MHYVIVVEETETGYSAYVPDLPGCISVGSSKEEIEKNIQEAVLFHLEGMKEDGVEIPKPKRAGMSIRLFDPSGNPIFSERRLPSGSTVSRFTSMS